MYPCTYRQLSLDYLIRDTGETLKTQKILRHVLDHHFPVISEDIYGCLFTMDIKDKDVFGKCIVTLNLRSSDFDANSSSQSLRALNYLNCLSELCVTASAATPERVNKQAKLQ